MRVFADLVYARHGTKTLTLDLVLPDGRGPQPVVLVVPGGGWRNCGKPEAGAFLLNEGFAVASRIYRVSEEAIAPACVFDCKRAVCWLRHHAADYGLDPTRIGVYGASAGGHLAALLAVSADVADLRAPDEELDGVSDVLAAACAVCGPTDLTRIATQRFRSDFPMLYEATSQFLGGPVEEREALARLVSPMSYVGPNVAPLLLIHGDADETVPVVETTSFAEALDRAGADIKTRIIEGAGHGWLADETRKDVAAFFRRTLRGDQALLKNR